MSLGAEVARRLEAGGADGAFLRMASRVWEAAVRLEAPLRWRATARVLVVGGATLGGSGKTPLACACAEELHDGGARATFVGHAYGAAPGWARFVHGQEGVRLVGDEALACQRQLAVRRIPVAVAPNRQLALDLALSRADLAIVDGPCQTRPRRATLALLAVDATDPWGAGRCPPRGDLRATREALLLAVDRVVAIAPEGGLDSPLDDMGGRPVDRACAISNGATLDGRLLGWSELAGCRIGLWTALARPHRVVRGLARRGIRPVVVQSCADHGPARLPAKSTCRGIDLWVCTAKCRSHLPAHLWGAPVATLDYALRLEAPLKAALARLDPGSGRP